MTPIVYFSEVYLKLYTRSDRCSGLCCLVALFIFD